MRFHVVALPHTVTSKAYCACAYTQKVLNFCKMMRSLGHEVFHYGAEGSEVDCTEHVTCITAAEQEKYFGAVDWHKTTFQLKWYPQEPYWQMMNLRAAAGILSRKQRGDFLCLIGGNCQKPIADIVTEADVIAVEYGVGYTGVFGKFRVFESYTHMSAVLGMQSQDPDGRLYDAVIPNYYDPADFPFQPVKGDYLLFLSRLASRKGIQIAVETAKAAGMKLILAGQGIREATPDYIVNEDGQRFELNENLQYAGYADVAKRAELMGAARALILPTQFLEPFGGVVAESALCGTPAITTDWAAFSETVKHGVTGYRCHTLEQFVWAAEHVHRLDREWIRDRAIANYSIGRVKFMYEEYFGMLLGLWGEGWPKLNPARTDLDWLNKL